MIYAKEDWLFSGSRFALHGELNNQFANTHPSLSSCYVYVYQKLI